MQARIGLILTILWAVVSACYAPTPVTEPTPAAIARVEFIGTTPHVFRYCEVRLGWTEQQLNLFCGYPIDTLERAGLGDDQRCAIYPSASHSLAADNHGAPFLAVCMEHMDAEAREAQRRLERSTLRQDAAVVIEERDDHMHWTVITVYGLSEYPGEIY